MVEINDGERSPLLPSAEVYEQEYHYWPWGQLLKQVADLVERSAPNGGAVVDYMCGTGYLLNKIADRRSDLRIAGCSITPSFVQHAKRAHSQLDIVLEDAMVYKPPFAPDIVLATGGLHHLARETQPVFVEKVASELTRNGIFVLGEEVIRQYDSEKQRRAASLELGSELLRHIVRAGAPDPVLSAAVDTLGNDLLERGEFKVPLRILREYLDPHFCIEEIRQIWPEGGEPYGDYVFICHKR